MRKANVGDVPAMPQGTPEHRVHGCHAKEPLAPLLAYRAALSAVTSCAWLEHGAASLATAAAPAPRACGMPAAGSRWRRRRGCTGETVVDRDATTQDPCVLVVGFRLRRARLGTHPLPLGRPAQVTRPVRGLPRPCLRAVAGRRRTRSLPGRLPVGRPGARRVLRPLPLAGARAGVGAGLDPLRGAARGATRRAAGPAAGLAGPRRCAAWWRRSRSDEARRHSGGAGWRPALALAAHDHGAQVRIVERRPEVFAPPAP